MSVILQDTFDYLGEKSPPFVFNENYIKADYVGCFRLFLLDIFLYVYQTQS